jgi:uncharacterized protein (TIGR02996 family)
MLTDDNFLAQLLAEPPANDTRLVYADWLEERGGPTSAAKAEFLRVTVELATGKGPRGWRKARRKRLQRLAAGLDTDWLAVVSRLAVENCQGKRAQAESRRTYPIRFDYLCDRRWEDLRPTDDPAVRACDGCRQDVHYCDTIMEARQHAHAGHCIAVDLGVIRREGDLEPERMYLGWPSPALLRQERERTQPDPVSAERERRKQEKKTKGEGAQVPGPA